MSLPDSSQIPGLEPPAGVVPNFIDPYTRGPMLLALSAVAIGIMYLFMIVRFYSKIYLQHQISWDDLTCTIGALGTTGYFIGLVFVEEAGFGTHQYNLRKPELLKGSFLKTLYLLVILQPLVALFIKVSFFIYYYQIFGPKPVLRWCIWIGAIVTTVFYSAVTVTLFVVSSPGHGVTLRGRLDSVLGGITSPILCTTIALGYFNVFSDLYILILPISGVMGLNLQPKRKIGVVLIFMTGLLALGSSSAALYYRYAVIISGDATWNVMATVYLITLELSIGIDCSCMPPCAAVIRRHIPLFVTFKSQISSFFRFLSARLSIGESSGTFRFFGSSGTKKSTKDQNGPRNPDGKNDFALKNLPEVTKGIHQMRKARSFIWGSKSHDTTTMDDEEKILST